MLIVEMLSLFELSLRLRPITLTELYFFVQVQIAIQTYELVDKHIRKLDGDLAKFESEMKENILNNDEVPKLHIYLIPTKHVSCFPSDSTSRGKTTRVKDPTFFSLDPDSAKHKRNLAPDPTLIRNEEKNIFIC